jgi:hypothetical protein
MMRAALFLLALATPAAAQDRAMLEFLLRDLDAPAEQKVLRAAAAACILGDGQVDAIAAPFTDAGWTRDDDTEMGIVALYPQGGNVGVTLYDDGRICDVSSEAWGTDTAIGALQIMAGTAGLTLENVDTGTECITLRVTPAVTVDITSTGQDPTCFSESTSTLRFTFAGAN